MFNAKISLTKLFTVVLIVLILFVLAYFKEIGIFLTTGKIENHLSLIQTIRPSLSIPRLGLEASVLPFGLTDDGSLDTPKLPTELGWYSLGVSPGKVGTAVIFGHRGWVNGVQATFDNLYKLTIGDMITYINEQGQTSTFLVRNLKIYNKDDNTSSVFSTNDSLAHLNLITCAGAWNEDETTYSERLVIFTDKVN